MTEFELIKKYFYAASGPSSAKPAWLRVGVGDDGAVLAADSREQVIVTDSLVEGVHFFAGTSAKAIAHKALAVNLSDLAAMGAEPRWATLNLTLPNSDDAWLADFAEGFYGLASAHHVALIGGDTTSGPLTVSVTAGGYLPAGQSPLLRSGAKAGDTLCVAGALGRAALAVQARKQHREADPCFAAALDYPQPLVAEGQQLGGIASAAIDVSDGLLADSGHIVEASNIAIELNGSALSELSPNPTIEGATAMLSGGDDYALLFTLPEGVVVPAWATAIGRVLPLQAELIGLDGGERWLQEAFKQARQAPGFQHF